MTVIAEEAGKALVPGPFFAAALLGVPIVIEGGSDAQKKELLPKMAKGEYIATVAIAEAAGRFDAGGIELKAGKKGADYTLSGEKFFVPDAHVADCIVVAARSAGSGENGVTLLMVPAKQKGVTVTQLKTVDMTRRLCHVKFDSVTIAGANLLGKEGQGWPILRRTLDIATAALVGRDGRHRAEGTRYRGRLRQDAGAVRQTDRILPGRQAQVRRHDGRGREHALAHLLRLLDGR